MPYIVSDSKHVCLVDVIPLPRPSNNLCLNVFCYNSLILILSFIILILLKITNIPKSFAPVKILKFVTKTFK